MSTKAPASLPRQIDVTLSDGTVVAVKKLGLGRYTELASVFEGLLGEVFSNLDQIKTDVDFIARLPHILINSMPQFIKLIQVSTGLEEQYLNESVGLDEGIELATAIFEVNNMTKIVSVIKNLMATLSTRT